MSDLFETGETKIAEIKVGGVVVAEIGFDNDPFSWRDRDDIVVDEQRAVAVYRNRVDGIVIRQEHPDGPDEDMFVVLRDDDAVAALIAALQAQIGGKR
jgi:hypothetical protein